MLAAAGVTEVAVHARPRVAIVSTGDEVVPPDTVLSPGQVRDATASALAAMVTEAGGEPSPRGIVTDDAEALAKTLQAALHDCDLVVVSAGSSVGARDQTAEAVESLGAPRRLLPRAGDQAGQADAAGECDGVPVIGLPGNPLSALVVFRMVGLPVLRRVAGITVTPRADHHGGAVPRGRLGRGPPRRGAGAAERRGRAHRDTAVQVLRAAVPAYQRRRLRRDPRGATGLDAGRP